MNFLKYSHKCSCALAYTSSAEGQPGYALLQGRRADGSWSKTTMFPGSETLEAKIAFANASMDKVFRARLGKSSPLLFGAARVNWDLPWADETYAHGLLPIEVFEWGSDAERGMWATSRARGLGRADALCAQDALDRAAGEVAAATIRRGVALDEETFMQALGCYEVPRTERWEPENTPDLALQGRIRALLGQQALDAGAIPGGGIEVTGPGRGALAPREEGAR